MTDLETALSSGSLATMLATAAGLGFLHTILGPDHYVPFVMMARADGWSAKKTAVITFLCGLGHVASSVVIGGGLAAAGIAYTTSQGEWENLQEARGNIASWALVGLGALLLCWGIYRARRHRPHSHAHVHPDGTVHQHPHQHSNDKHNHTHAPSTKIRRFTPWVLFLIFVFGPCESLIPLMLASTALAGFAGASLVAGAFSLATILTIMVSVAVLLRGMSRFRLHGLDRWSTALAGLSLVLCGLAIQYLGL